MPARGTTPAPVIVEGAHGRTLRPRSQRTDKENGRAGVGLPTHSANSGRYGKVEAVNPLIC